MGTWALTTTPELFLIILAKYPTTFKEIWRSVIYVPRKASVGVYESSCNICMNLLTLLMLTVQESN